MRMRTTTRQLSDQTDTGLWSRRPLFII